MKGFGENTVVQWVVYLCIRTVIAALDALSDRASLKVGRLVGRLMHLVDRKHRKIARKNLLGAEPPVCREDDVPKLIRRTYEHLGLSAVELLRFPRAVLGGKTKDLVRLVDFDILDRVLEKGRGAIIVIAHLGNWEVAGLAASKIGYPLNSLARPIRNRFFDRYVNRLRAMTGQRIIPKYDAWRAMTETLRRNEILVIQVDQDARKSGVLPRFFGRPASTVRSPALLSLRYGVPILPGEVHRKNGRQILRIHEPIEPASFRGRNDAVEALTQEYTSRLEECIRRNPTQWLWLHRRWKSADRAARKRADG